MLLSSGAPTAQLPMSSNSIKKLKDDIQLHARFVKSGSKDDVQLHARFVKSGSKDDVQLHTRFVNSGSRNPEMTFSCTHIL